MLRVHLLQDDAEALKPAELMRTIYERILSRMEADGFRVFQKRYRLSKAEKLLRLALLSILSGVLRHQQARGNYLIQPVHMKGQCTPLRVRQRPHDEQIRFKPLDYVA